MTAVPIDFLAAHSKYEAAREALSAFRMKHRALLDQEQLLKTANNEALAEVKKIYKTKHKDMPKSYGEFSIRTAREVDVELLISMMGTDPEVKKIYELEYKLDREKYNRLVKLGVIPSEVVGEIESDGKMSVYGPKEA